MARIVVTGGAGYVGLPLSRRLVDRGHDVTVIDTGISGADRLDQVRTFARVETADITDPAACASAVERAAPEKVMHLAAIHFIPECNRRPVDAVRVNVLGTQNVLNACAQARSLSKVLITSSAAVYPIADAFFKETDAIGPTDIYGITKATNERQGQEFAMNTGVQTVAVRLYNVYGPGETNPHLLPDIVEQLRVGKTRLALGNVTPKRCYVYIDDVVDGFEAMLETAFPDTFSILNLGRREEASVTELLALASVALGKALSSEGDPQRVRPSDRPFLRCDPDLTAALTGWRAETSIADGLRRLLRHERILC